MATIDNFLNDFRSQNPGINTNIAKKSLKNAKISIVGTPAVGKTTLSRLIRGQQISGMYKPTMGFKLGNTDVDGIKFSFWDFGGQKAYLKQHLSKYVYGSDIIFVVTDSTPKNVLTTKELVDHSKDLVEDSCEIIAIANKQDLDGHLAPDRVEDVLHIPTFPMVAIDKNNRQHMIELISKLMHYVEVRKRSEN
ncbi:MAG: ADP-ribosylation factor-like protein [Promethearchaeota archaeon]